MSTNASARKCRILIGGVNYSAAFETARGSDTAYSESGLIPHQATFVLRQTEDFPLSLDPRDFNSALFRGQTIDFYVPDSTGLLRRWCYLYLLSAVWSLTTKTLTIQAGDRLNYLAGDEEPTNPDDSQIDPKQATSARVVINRLAQKLGVSIAGAIHDFNLNYPINLQGHLKTIGGLAYSSGGFVWTDPNGQLQMAAVSLSGVAKDTLIIGEDEEFYEPISGAEAPAQRVKAVGVTKIVSFQNANPKISERYEAGICVERIENQETWSDSQQTLTLVTKHYLRRSAISPDSADYLGINELRLAELKTTTKYFENSRSGKVLKEITEIQRPFSTVLGTFCQYHKERNTAVWATLKAFVLVNLIPTEHTTVKYSYTFKEQLESIETRTYLTEGEILSQTVEDYSKWVRYPDLLREAVWERQSWQQEQAGSKRWAYTLTKMESFAKAKPQLIAKTTTYDQKINLVGVPGDRQISSDIRPPNYEPRPAKYAYEDQPVTATILIPQRSGTPEKIRTKTIDVPYLEGIKRQGANLVTLGEGYSAQLERVAKLEGAVLYGRWTGQEIVCGLRDSFFQRKPLMLIDCVEPTERIRTFAANGFTWQITKTKALCSFDGVWVGNRLSTNRSITLRLTQTAEPLAELIEVEPLQESLPIDAEITIEGVLVKLTQAAKPGETLLHVAPIESEIPALSSAIYAEALIETPYVQSVSIELAFGEAMEIEVLPYSLEPVVHSVDLVFGEAIATQSVPNQPVDLAIGLAINVDTYSIHPVNLSYGDAIDLPMPIRVDLATGDAVNLQVYSGRFRPFTSSLKGRTGMTLARGFGSWDNNAQYIYELGFHFPCWDGSYRSENLAEPNIYVVSNSYITFGYATTQSNGFSHSSPGRGLFIAAADRSYQRVYYQNESADSFRIRFEGSVSTFGYDNEPEMVWEATLYADGAIMLVTGRMDAVNGFSSYTSGNGEHYVNFTPAPNKSWVFQRVSSTVATVQEGSYI